MYQVKSKSGIRLEIREIEEKLEKIEKNERKLETLCSRVENLENLSSTNNINNNGELQVVTTEQPSDVGNTQEQQVTVFYFHVFFNPYPTELDFKNPMHI